MLEIVMVTMVPMVIVTMLMLMMMMPAIVKMCNKYARWQLVPILVPPTKSAGCLSPFQILIKTVANLMLMLNTTTILLMLNTRTIFLMLSTRTILLMLNTMTILAMVLEDQLNQVNVALLSFLADGDEYIMPYNHVADQPYICSS